MRVAGSGHSFTDAALHRRRDAPARRPRPHARRRPLVGARPRRGRDRDRRARRAPRRATASRWRTRATSTTRRIAGAISTATHGTGVRFHNLSAQVEAVELVLRRRQRARHRRRLGSATTCSPRASGSARSGSLYSVTLRTVPAYTIHRVDHPLSRSTRRSRASTSSSTATTTSSSTSSRTPRRRSLRESERTDEPPRPRSRAARVLPGGRARELARRRLRADRARLPGPHPADGALSRPPGRALGEGRRQPPRLREPSAASASPRWSTGSRASTAPRRFAACSS